MKRGDRRNHLTRLRAYAAKLQKAISGPDDTGKTFVYILRCDRSGLVKIGKTRDVAKRVATIQSYSASPLNIVALMVDERANSTTLEIDIEALLHERFAKYRRHGEWFELPLWEIKALGREAGTLIVK